MAEEKAKIKPPKSDKPMGDFDPHQTHYRDPQTNKIIKVKPFRLIIDNGHRYYEYPKGSGNLWWEDRTFAGALNDDGRPVRGKAHSDWQPPETADDRISRENAVLKQNLEKVQKELEEIRREEELEKTHPKASPKQDKKSATKPAKSEVNLDQARI